MPAVRTSTSRRRLVSIAALGSAGIAIFAFLLRFARVTKYFPGWWPGWGRGLMMSWAFLTVLLVTALAVSHILPEARPEYSPARRNFLKAGHVALFGAPVLAVGYGVFIGRFDLRLREVEIQIPGLHPDLDGLRLVQITDIHLSPFLPVKVLDRAIAMANETRANIALVTGDLISTVSDPVDLCMDRLAGLRADAGIFGCMGNHEIYANAEDHVAERGARLGMCFLRDAAEPLKFGKATMNLAGVDYQHKGDRYLVHTERLILPGAFNVLMSHNPDVFPVAANQGWQFTIAGHTHGGQVRFEILREDLNLARFFTPYVDGIYRRGPVFHFRFARHRDDWGSGTPGRASGGGADTPVPHLILSDIHANLEALDAVLADARGKYDRIMCLGDLVGYGADPNAIVDWARTSGAVFVRGNHDKACSGGDNLDHYNPSARASAIWTRGALTPANVEFLRDLPRGPLRYEDFDLVHGSPVDEDDYLISLTDVAPLRDFVAAQATFFGHTHVQGGFLLARGGVKHILPDGTLELEPHHFYLLNPGAVGQPRDGDPRAAYALYWPEEGIIEYRRVDYDIPTVAGKIREAGLPDGLAARLYLGIVVKVVEKTGQTALSTATEVGGSSCGLPGDRVVSPVF